MIEEEKKKYGPDGGYEQSGSAAPPVASTGQIASPMGKYGPDGGMSLNADISNKPIENRQALENQGDADYYNAYQSMLGQIQQKQMEELNEAAQQTMFTMRRKPVNPVPGGDPKVMQSQAVAGMPGTPPVDAEQEVDPYQSVYDFINQQRVEREGELADEQARAEEVEKMNRSLSLIGGLSDGAMALANLLATTQGAYHQTLNPASPALSKNAEADRAQSRARMDRIKTQIQSLDNDMYRARLSGAQEKGRLDRVKAEQDALTERAKLNNETRENVEGIKADAKIADTNLKEEGKNKRADANNRIKAAQLAENIRHHNATEAAANKRIEISASKNGGSGSNAYWVKNAAQYYDEFLDETAQGMGYADWKEFSSARRDKDEDDIYRTLNVADRKNKSGEAKMRGNISQWAGETAPNFVERYSGKKKEEEEEEIDLNPGSYSNAQEKKKKEYENKYK